VCPKGLINLDVAALLEMEAFCRDYHVPPLGAGVGYLEYPQRMVDAFAVISETRERLRQEELRKVGQTGATSK
jgi:hypothetical protein